MSEDDWDEPPESYSPEVVIASVNEEVARELDSLLEYARERRAFGTMTMIQNRPDPGAGSKGNKTGEAYGSGYEEASMDFFNEITKRLSKVKKP